jgi:Uma2 family endonuclease
MAVVTHPVVTPPEFTVRMDDAGWDLPLELIAGEVVYVTPAATGDAFTQLELAHAVRTWQGAHAGVVLTDVFVRILDSYLAPDVAFWAPGREPEIGRGAALVVPDLVAEVLSPRTRENDLGAKRALYLESGVRELWFADPEARTVARVTADGEVRLGGDATLTSPLLPDFAVPLPALFG